MWCRYPAMLSRRITSAAPDMDLLHSGEMAQRLQVQKFGDENNSYVRTESERIRNSENWVLKLNQDGAQQPSNRRPDFAQAKRECKRLHDEYMAKTQQEKRAILEANKKDEEKNKRSKELKNTTVQSVLERAGGSFNWRWETCRLRRHELGPVSVGREVNFPTTDGVRRQNTHSHDTFQHVQLITARTAHMFHSPREHAWLKSFALVCRKQFVIPASCIRCSTCHRTLLHDLSHLHHLSSDLLPRCRVFRKRIKKPCEFHGGVAYILNLHLPQKPNESQKTKAFGK